MLHLATKAFWPGKVPFPVLHVDTGHNFPEVIEFRDRTVERLGLKLVVGSVQEFIDRGELAERADGTRNPLQTVPLLDAIQREQVRRRLRRRPPRRGQGPRQGAHPEPARRVRPVGPAQPAPRAVEPVQRPPHRGPARPRVPDQQLDRAGRLALHRARRHRAAAACTTPTSARSLPATACGARSARSPSRAARGSHHQDRPLPHGGRHVLHRRRRVGRRHRARRRRSKLPPPPSPNVAPPGPMTASPRPPWKTARRTATSNDHRHCHRPAPRRSGEPPLATATLFRFATAGSVDDGKSTLVGRLLHDSKAILADQLDAVARTSADRGFGGAARRAIDLALLTDGLRAEREQGITIDVAYRYFATDRRSFILADCPGHVQYTKNTVTGASTADAVVVLIDARKGVLEQTRRHLSVLQLLRVAHVIVAVNKIDLVDFSEDVFREIEADVQQVRPRTRPRLRWHRRPAGGSGFRARRRQRGGPLGAHPLVRRPGAARGPRDPAGRRRARKPPGELPLPGAAGDPAAGRAGSRRRRRRARRRGVPRLPRLRRPDHRGLGEGGGPGQRPDPGPGPAHHHGDGHRLRRPELAEAVAPQSVAMRLADEFDVARGDTIAAAGTVRESSADLYAALCWLSPKPLREGAKVLVKHGTRTVQALVRNVDGQAGPGHLQPRGCLQPGAQRHRPRAAPARRAAAAGELPAPPPHRARSW